MSSAPPAQPKKVLRVTEVTNYLRALIEGDARLRLIQVQGEVTNLSRSPSGWVYFSVKDSQSQLGCVISARVTPNLGAELAALQNGVTVLLEGDVVLYEARGVYQLNVGRMRIGGAGAARLRFERLRQKLEDEGLFAQERKRTLPPYPKILILITAPGSQAYHDIIRRLQQLWPRVTVVVAGVAVQGDTAADQIVTAIDIANRSTRGELIILARGGGAPEELDAFNRESLARAIYASRIPVVTGIGHTQDTTIADLVADVCAATPTAAAIVSVPNGPALSASCHQTYGNLRSHAVRGMTARRSHLTRLESDLLRLSPHNRLATRRQRLDNLWTDLVRAVDRQTESRRKRLAGISRELQALSPTAVLSRGYALLSDAATGAVIASTAAASSGRKLTAHVKDGTFPVTVSEQ